MTVNGCPVMRFISVVSTLAITSMPWPTGNGTTAVTCRLGQASWACALQATRAPAMAVAVMIRVVRVITTNLLIGQLAKVGM